MDAIYDEINIDQVQDPLLSGKEVSPSDKKEGSSVLPDTDKTLIQMTPLQLNLPTPKPMPKPFNPPSASYSKLRQRNQKASGNRKNKDKTAVCVPLLNPRNVQKAVKNNIIGDSYYSEEDNSEGMSSFEESSRSGDEDIDRSEDRSNHSS